jgi:acyl dehydratase
MTPEVGTLVPAWEIESVSPEPMKVMALVLRDPNPIHFDAVSLRRLGLPERPINQGPNNVGYVINMLLAWAGDPGALEAIRVRFRANVLAGDRVVAGGRVTDVEHRADGVHVTCDVWLDRGEVRVLDGTARVRWAGGPA